MGKHAPRGHGRCDATYIRTGASDYFGQHAATTPSPLKYCSCSFTVLQASLAHAEWKGHKVNCVDTPGYDDFVAEVMGALAVVETALVFVKADSGVEVGTERVWRELNALHRPRFVVVNKMDKEHANFDQVVATLQQRLSHQVAPLHLPIGRADGFKGEVLVQRSETAQLTREVAG